MFSGIIRHSGTVTAITRRKSEDVCLSIDAHDLGASLSPGDSVACDGVCLTVADIEETIVHFDVMPVSLDKTNLGSKQIGDRINLETSLRVGDKVDGHFVYGHVDGVGKVRKIESSGESTLMTFRTPESVRPYIAPQGSIAVNGVSLTIAKYEELLFTVSLVAYTMDHTNLSDLRIGSPVNIEADMLAKYVNRKVRT